MLFFAMLLPAVLSTTASSGAALERGVATTDPQALRDLDGTGLNLGRLLGAGADASSAALFALPSMAPVSFAIDREFDRYASRHAAALAAPADGSAKFQLFDRASLYAAFRDGSPPDFVRGFSARPQPKRSKELAGTTYVNGWGAQCYAAGPDAAPVDKSFASWTCAEGLTCQTPATGANASRAGFCFPKSN